MYVCVCKLGPAYTHSAPILHHVTDILGHHLSRPGERGLEVRRHGDRPPVPLDLCRRLCLWHHRDVPTASLPELHHRHLPPRRPLGSQLQVSLPHPAPRPFTPLPSVVQSFWVEEDELPGRGALPTKIYPSTSPGASPPTHSQLHLAAGPAALLLLHQQCC